MQLAGDDKLDKVVNFWSVQKNTQDMPISGWIHREKVAPLYVLLHKGDSEPPFQLFTHTHTINIQIFVVTIFRGLNFRGD